MKSMLETGKNIIPSKNRNTHVAYLKEGDGEFISFDEEKTLIPINNEEKIAALKVQKINYCHTYPHLCKSGISSPRDVAMSIGRAIMEKL